MPLVRIEADQRGWPALVPAMAGQAAEASRAAAALFVAHRLGCYGPVCFDFRAQVRALSEFGAWRPLVARLDPTGSDADSWRRYSAIASQVRKALRDVGLVVPARRFAGGTCAFSIADGVAIECAIDNASVRGFAMPNTPAMPDEADAGTDGHRWGDPPPLTAADLTLMEPRAQRRLRLAHNELRAAHDAYESRNAVNIANAAGRLASATQHLTSAPVSMTSSNSPTDEIGDVVQVLIARGADPSLSATERGMLVLVGVECALLLRHRLHFRLEFDVMRALAPLAIRGHESSTLAERAALRWHHVLIETCAFARQTDQYASLSRDGRRWREGLLHGMRASAPGAMPWLADYALNLSLMIFDAVDAAGPKSGGIAASRDWLAQHEVRFTPQQHESVGIRNVLCSVGFEREGALARLATHGHEFHRTLNLWAALLDAARARVSEPLAALAAGVDRDLAKRSTRPR